MWDIARETPWICAGLGDPPDSASGEPGRVGPHPLPALHATHPAGYHSPVLAARAANGKDEIRDT